jgi:hypothetical protein
VEIEPLDGAIIDRERSYRRAIRRLMAEGQQKAAVASTRGLP